MKRQNSYFWFCITKVVTILRAYWDLLETTQVINMRELAKSRKKKACFSILKMFTLQEWELSKESEKVLAKGSHLAEV